VSALLNDNSIEKEIQGIFWPAIEHSATISLFRNRFLSQATKILLYKTLTRPVVTHGVETWAVTKKEEQAVLIFGRKTFIRIFGLQYENGGMEK
jgi:hypothetical protein